MNIKRILLTSIISLGALCGFAQQAEVTQYVFKPYWYGQLQIGGQETLGEGAFDKLLSPNGQIAVGYQFNPLFGLRLGVNAWQSKGIMKFRNNEGNWKYNYVAPALDFTVNLSNAFCGFNPTRVVDLNLFAGVGANVAFKNDQAVEWNAQMSNGLDHNVLQHIWDGTKTRLLGRFGLACDFRVSQRVSLGLEVAANVLNDHYNSKKADNADWYFNGLVGLKYTFGPTFTKKSTPVVLPEPEIIVEKETIIVHDTIVIEREVPVQQPVIEQPREEGLQRNVFYTINNYTISAKEMVKVKEVAEYMKAHPKSKVLITGYADSGTGTISINVRLARLRAQAVVNALVKTYGIDPMRISSSHMTDHEFQPFPDEPVKNRVAICVVE